MDKIKRNERLAAMTQILTSSPNRIFTLSHFCELFSTAKSTVSEDVAILQQTMNQFRLGKLETVTGAAGGVRYRAKTDGARNPCYERFVWSASANFADVLPSIPNPPSPHRALTAEYEWCHCFAGNREKDKAYWRDRRRRGLPGRHAGAYQSDLLQILLCAL